MGYEIVFTYHEKKENGGYDLENQKTFKREVGKPEDDTSLDDVARFILKQLARRDKFIVGVEPYEFIKKKISFKETNGGIILNRKKFILDQGEISSQDLVDQTPAEQVPQVATPQQSRPTNTAQTKANVPLHSMREEMFDPQYPGMAKETQRRGFKFTIGKKYPIYEERPAPGGTMAGINYKTRDDDGNIQVLNSLHFRPIVKLANGFDESDVARKRPEEEHTSQEPKGMGMVDIRRMASGGMLRGR